MDTNHHRQLMTQWISNYTDCMSIISDIEVYCNCCQKTILSSQKCRIEEHVKTKTHQARLNQLPPDTFNQDLCETFVTANIPLMKLQHPVLRNFLKKYTKKNIPNESTLRQTYLPKVYYKVIDKIKLDMSNKAIWVSVDETTDIMGRFMVHIIVGILHPTQHYKPHLIACKVIEQVNAKSIAELVHKSLTDFFNTFDQSRVYLFVTDAAAYMLKAGKLLKEVFPNMLHITCVAHALHHICEFVKDEFQDVDKLLATFKKIFLKAPRRIQLYKEKCPNLPLPPKQVLTRRGTWIDTCVFFSKNYESLASVIHALDDDDQSIKQCKEVLKSPDLVNQLNFIEYHFSDLPTKIKYFENRNVLLKESLNTLDILINKLKGISGDFGNRLSNKTDLVFSRNPDINILQEYYKGKPQSKYMNILANFTFAPLSSCDVERSFSVFKEIFLRNRTSFTESNLEKVIIINVNNST